MKYMPIHQKICNKNQLRCVRPGKDLISGHPSRPLAFQDFWGVVDVSRPDKARLNTAEAKQTVEYQLHNLDQSRSILINLDQSCIPCMVNL